MQEVLRKENQETTFQHLPDIGDCCVPNHINSSDTYELSLKENKKIVGDIQLVKTSYSQKKEPRNISR